MDKIPTLFLRDPVNPGHVTREVHPDCEWVLRGEGVATRKRDGTNIRVHVRDGRCELVEKRKNPSAEAKEAGEAPGYVKAERFEPNDKHIFAAVEATDFSTWPDGAWPVEALGPKIQGGRESDTPTLYAFSLPALTGPCAIEVIHNRNALRTYDTIRDFLATAWIEGIVFHHPDGRRCKVKRKDMGFAWPVARGVKVQPQGASA
jgi:hypothetical protein